MAQTKYLTRSEQAKYLSDLGLPTTKGTLQKKATTGGGPRYVIYGNKALSTTEWLDEYAEANIRAPRRSTSELAEHEPGKVA